MFDHVGFDVRDLKKSVDFYESALAPLGAKKLLVLEEYGVVGFGPAGGHPRFWISEGAPKGGDDEVHVCFSAKTRSEVDAVHAAATKAGGRDHGKPGLRPEYHPNYYGAFVLDPDGINVEACCHSPA